MAPDPRPSTGWPERTIESTSFHREITRSRAPTPKHPTLQKSCSALLDMGTIAMNDVRAASSSSNPATVVESEESASELAKQLFEQQYYPSYDLDEQAMMENIGRTIKQRRTDLKMTRKEASLGVDVNIEYFARIERGQNMPSLCVLCKMAKQFQISVDVLLGLTRDSLRPPEGAASQRDPQDTPQWRLLRRRLRKARPETLQKVTRILAMLEGTGMLEGSIAELWQR